MVEKAVKLLENTVYYCNRCSNLVREIDNIGQWDCKIRLRNPITGGDFEVRSDHGPVLDNPEFITEPTLARRLPMINNKEAVSVRPVGDGNGNMKNVIIISRYFNQTNLYSSDFIKFEER